MYGKHKLREDKIMKNIKSISSSQLLPESYEYSHKINLKTDKKINFWIQAIFIVVALVMVFLAVYLKLPIQSDLKTITKILITVVFVVIYMFFHELTHGICIRLLSKKKLTYAIRFPFLITGSQTYFNKFNFIIIALAPVIIWGIILSITIFFIPQFLLLSTYVVLGLNFAGSSGDYMQVYYLSKCPRYSLIQDDGNETKVFIMRDK